MSDPPLPRGEQTRRTILAAAERLFAAKGPDGASTREIARAAGVTQPLILHHFGSKEALFREVVDTALQRLASAQAVPLDAGSDDLDFVVGGLAGLVRHTGTDPALLRLATWGRLQGFEPFTRGGAAFWGSIAQRFEQARRRGVVRADLDLQAALIVVDSAVKGFAERASTYERLGLLPGGREAAGNELLRILVFGLVAPEHGEEAARRLDRLLIVR